MVASSVATTQCRTRHQHPVPRFPQSLSINLLLRGAASRMKTFKTPQLKTLVRSDVCEKCFRSVGATGKRSMRIP